MNFLNASLRGPQTPSAETKCYAYGNATGSSAKTHAPDGVGRFHRRAKGMRRGPRAVRLRVISNGGVAPKPPCGVCADVCCIAFDACERFRFCHGPAFAGPLEGSGGGCRRAQRLPSPAHAGRRAAGSAREAVKANALLFAFARTERRTWMGYTGVPAGAPCEAHGSAACGTAALFWVLFWCQKSTAAQALRIRAVWRVVIFRRWNLRGQAAIKRCVHAFLAKQKSR